MKCKICGKELETADNYKFRICCNCETDTASFLKLFNNREYYPIKPSPSKRVLLVEDGSVDLEELEKLGIEYIVYRQGSNPPYWIEIKGE